MQTPIKNLSPDSPPPALTHVESWIFDLDNTLYPASSNLFAQIDVKMRQFIAEALDLTLDEAYALQKHYYREYGTTLRGLMLVHNIEPGIFLAYVHDIDCSVLPLAPDLDAALGQLPGRKIIFTNGSERHAENVLARLNLTRHFDAIFDIQAADYIPKPKAETYNRMADFCGIDTRRSAMFEDIARNLAPAAAAGMTTVWVREDGHAGWGSGADNDVSHVDHVTNDLAGWLTGVVAARSNGIL
ncbi:MAG TPA: pyrimidine 5'-nucleotidase [Telmatospirillum sp.]|nr:pyrimidine 5'-nucleotidase [Telmatospirillum sp.]